MVQVFLKLKSNKFGMRAEVESLDLPQEGGFKYYRIDKKTGNKMMGVTSVSNVDYIEEAPEKEIKEEEE